MKCKNHHRFGLEDLPSLTAMGFVEKVSPLEVKANQESWDEAHNGQGGPVKDSIPDLSF